MKRLLFALLFFTSSVGFAREGSWTSGGGGTGFACFNNAESAQALRGGADLGQRPDLLADLRGVTLTDIWENRNNTFIEPAEGESPRSYVENAIYARLGGRSPEFYKTLEDYLSRVSLAMTERKGKLHASHDTGAMNVWPTDNETGDRAGGVPVEPSQRCVQVQIALRTSVVGAKGKKHLSVFVDKTLYDHLGDSDPKVRIINQGALLLHEALYLLGSDLGQKTSLNARRLTTMLLSNDKVANFQEIEATIQRQDPGAIQPSKMTMNNEIAADGFDISNLKRGSRRASSLASAMARFRKAQARMISGIRVGSDESRRAVVINFYSRLSPAESLSGVAIIAAGRGILSDALVLTDTSNPEYAQSLHAVCHFAEILTVNDDEGDPEKFAAVNGMYIRAKSYCESRGL